MDKWIVYNNILKQRLWSQLCDKSLVARKASEYPRKIMHSAQCLAEL